MHLLYSFGLLSDSSSFLNPIFKRHQKAKTVLTTITNSDTFLNPSERSICVKGANVCGNCNHKPLDFSVFLSILQCIV